MKSQLDVASLKSDHTIWSIFHKLLLIQAGFYVVSFFLFSVMELLNIITKQFHRNCSLLYHLALISFIFVCLANVLEVSFDINGWGTYTYLQEYISVSSLFFSFIVLLFIPTVTIERFYATKYVNCYEGKVRNQIPMVLIAIQLTTAVALTGLLKTIDYFALNAYFTVPIYALVALLMLMAIFVNKNRLMKRNIFYRDCEIKLYYLSREYQIKENITWCKMTESTCLLIVLSIGIIAGIIVLDFTFNILNNHGVFSYTNLERNILRVIYEFSMCLSPFVYGIFTLVYLDKWWNKLTKFYETQIEQCTPAHCKVGPSHMSVMADPQSTTNSQQQNATSQADAYFAAVTRQWS